MSVIDRMKVIESELEGLTIDEITMLPDAVMFQGMDSVATQQLVKAAKLTGHQYDPATAVSLNYFENNQGSRFLSLPRVFERGGKCFLAWGETGAELTGDIIEMGARLIQRGKTLSLSVAKVPFNLAIEGEIDEGVILDVIEAETFEELAGHLREKIETVKLSEALTVAALKTGKVVAKRYERRDKEGYFAKGRFVPTDADAGPFLAYLPDGALDGGLIDGREYAYRLDDGAIQLDGLGTYPIGFRTHKLGELEVDQTYTFVEWQCRDDKYWSIKRDDGLWFSANASIKKSLQLDPVITPEQPATFTVVDKRPFGKDKVQVTGRFKVHIPHEGPTMAELMRSGGKVTSKPPAAPPVDDGDVDDIPF